jgi:cytochrome c553
MKPTRLLRLLLLCAATAAAANGALGDDANPGGAKVENPFRGVMQDRSAKSPDEALFVEKCGMCHRQMGMGTVILARRLDPKIATLEARTDLAAEWIAVAVRRGTGNMPRIGRGELSDAELVRVAAYLARKRR